MRASWSVVCVFVGMSRIRHARVVESRARCFCRLNWHLDRVFHEKIKFLKLSTSPVNLFFQIVFWAKFIVGAFNVSCRGRFFDSVYHHAFGFRV